MEQPKTHSALVRNFYFWTGIVATIAYRIINFLTDFSPLWTKIAWYIGTVGFILYFIHRYEISERRAKLILEYNLFEKVNNLDGLTAEEKNVMSYIFKTLQSSKEKWNYIVIFTASGLALLLGIYSDFIAKM
jgi:hypothetical protein